MQFPRTVYSGMGISSVKLYVQISMHFFVCGSSAQNSWLKICSTNQGILE